MFFIYNIWVFCSSYDTRSYIELFPTFFSYIYAGQEYGQKAYNNRLLPYKFGYWFSMFTVSTTLWIWTIVFSPVSNWNF